MPVHLPSNTFLINKAKGTATIRSSSANLYMKQRMEINIFF